MIRALLRFLRWLCSRQSVSPRRPAKLCRELHPTGRMGGWCCCGPAHFVPGAAIPAYWDRWPAETDGTVIVTHVWLLHSRRHSWHLFRYRERLARFYALVPN